MGYCNTSQLVKMAASWKVEMIDPSDAKGKELYLSVY